MASIEEIIKITNAKVVNDVNVDYANASIDHAISCDLMSDVLMFLRKHFADGSFDEEHSMMITGLATFQAIRTAEILDIQYILFVRGKVPTQEVIDQATKDGILLLTTDYLMYRTCGELFASGVKGIL